MITAIDMLPCYLFTYNVTRINVPIVSRVLVDIMTRQANISTSAGHVGDDCRCHENIEHPTATFDDQPSQDD